LGGGVFNENEEIFLVGNLSFFRQFGGIFYIGKMKVKDSYFKITTPPSLEGVTPITIFCHIYNI
jgi:hypothetical protein